MADRKLLLIASALHEMISHHLFIAWDKSQAQNLNFRFYRMVMAFTPTL